MVHVVVPGWGPPHIDQKRWILFNNLRLLDRTRVGHKLRVTVFCYGKEPVLVDRCVPSHIPVTIVYTPGIIGQFLYQFVTPSSRLQQDDDHILLIMDDVELEPQTYHLGRHLATLQKSGLDILSPAMTDHSKRSKAYWVNRAAAPATEADSRKKMERQAFQSRCGGKGPTTSVILPADVWSHQDNNLEYAAPQEEDNRDGNGQQLPLTKTIETVRQMHQLEYYIYLMTWSTYVKYYELMSDDSKWMYGVDLILHKEGLKVGIWDTARFTHQCAGESSNALMKLYDPWAEMRRLGVRRNQTFDWHKCELAVTHYCLDTVNDLLATRTVSSWSHTIIAANRPTVAVCWLTVELNTVLRRILQYLQRAHPDVDIFYVQDKPQQLEISPKPNSESMSSKSITALAAPDGLCEKLGFKNTIGAMTKPLVSAWDKMLYFFTKQLDAYDIVWVIEDDVMITSIAAFDNFLAKYTQNNNHDLVVAEHRVNADGQTKDWWWFRTPPTHIPAPWHASMVCTMSMSRKLLHQIEKRVAEKGTLFFNEIMFSTLANKANLTVTVAPELRDTIVWRHDWTEADFAAKPMGFFHPCKQITQHVANGRWSMV